MTNANNFNSSVANGVSLTNTGANNIAITAAGALQLGTVSMTAASTGTLTMAFNGNVTQSGVTTIVTPKLVLNGTGNSTLTNNNNIGAVAATVTGSVDVTNSAGNPMTVGVAGTGISTSGFAVTLTTSGGAGITINQAINTGPGGPGGTLTINGGVIVNVASPFVLGPAGANITLNSGGPDFILNANMPVAGAVTISVTRDIILNAVLSTTQQNDAITLTADSGNTGTGGVWIRTSGGATGEVSADGSVTITGSKIFNAPSLSGLVANAGVQVDAGAATVLAGQNATGANGAILINEHAAATGNVVINGTVQTSFAAAAATIDVFDNGGATLIQLGANLTSAAGNITLHNNVSLTSAVILNSSSGNTTFSGTVNGAEALIVDSAGTTAFDGVVGGTSGAPTVTSVLVSGATVINTTGIFTTGTQDYTLAATFGSGANEALTGSTVTFHNTIVGDNHNLTITGNGTFDNTVDTIGALSVSGNATFAGVVGGTSGAPTLTSVLVGGTTAINTTGIFATGTQDYTLAATLGAGADEALTGTTVTFHNTLVGDNHNLTVTGNGTFDGTVSTIGALSVSNNAIFDGVVNIASLTVTGATTINTTRITTSGASGQSYAGVTLGSSATLDASAGPGHVSISGGVTNNAASSPITLTIKDGDGTSSIAGAITDNGSVSTALTLSSGTLTLTGNNSYSGATTIVSGTDLTLSGSGAIAGSSGVADSGTFDISGTTSGASITTISSAGNVNLGARTLTVTNASTTFAGVIASGAGGGLTLTAGTLTLSGVNTYAGATAINGGSLILSGSGAIGDSSGVTVAAMATFDISNTTAGATIATLNDNGVVALGAETLTVDSGVTFAGTATLSASLTSASTNGELDVLAGAINLGSATLSLTSTFLYQVGDTVSIIVNGLGSAITGTFSNLAQGSEFAVGSNFFTISYTAGAANDVVLTTVQSVPTISSVSPNNGPVTGGTSITIMGSQFLPGATVTIGGVAATGVVVVNAMQITAVTPAGMVGAVNVVVTNLDGGTITATSSFTFTPVNHLVLTTPPAANVNTFSAFSLVVTAVSASGSTLASFTGNVTISIINGPSGATLGGTLTVAAINGIATFAGLTVNMAGSYTFTISATGLSSTTATLTAAGSNTQPPPPATISATTGGAGSTVTVTFTNSDGTTTTQIVQPFGAFSGTVTTATGSLPSGIQVLVIAPGIGSFGGPNIVGINQNGTTLYNFMAFAPQFVGGVSIATASLSTGDFLIGVGAGPGGGPELAVFDGATGAFKYSLFAFGQNFVGGITVTSAHLFGNGSTQFVVAAGPGGGPEVAVFDAVTGNIITAFFAYDANGPTDTFLGGVMVASGNVLGQGHDDIITGPGPGGGSNVRVYDLSLGTNGAVSAQQSDSFFAYSPDEFNGVRVGAKALNNAAVLSILTARGPGGASENSAYNALQVAVFDTSFTFNPLTGQFTAAPISG